MSFETFVLAVHAPLVAVVEDAPSVLHAVDMEPLIRAAARDDVDLLSACGLVVKLLPIVDEERGERGAGLWPPRVAALPDGVTRCRTCHKATGSRRPRSDLTRRSRAER